MNPDFARQIHGISCAARPCPRHRTPMQLAAGRSAPDSAASTLHWWCTACHGFWSELYFVHQVEARDPRMLGVESNLQLPCPGCGSIELIRQCHFICCDNFLCASCGISIAVTHEILEDSPLPEEKLKSLRFEEIDVSQERPPAIFHPVQLETAACADEFCYLHPERPVTLREDPGARDERQRFHWVCIDCLAENPEILEGASVCGFRKSPPPAFFSSSRPPYQCRICHHGLFDGPDLQSLRCRSCQTLMKLRLEASPAES